jgi:hypothetical protein
MVLMCVSCKGPKKSENKNNETMTDDLKSRYGYNIGFLKKHTGVIELRNGGSAVAIIPDWQGRVMTSTAEGELGFSFGWINHELIAAGKIQPHINAFGGEERLWLGPEGGQFSVFFKKGSRFIFDDWHTPSFLDTTPFEVISRSDSSVLLSYDAEIDNYSGTHFRFRLQRKVVLLTANDILKQTGIEAQGIKCVAYRSENEITNTGEKEWTKETGLLSIWMLGMFNPSPAVVVVIPYNPGDESIMGAPVNDNYFGKIESSRLKVTDSHIFFRADGKSRGKIGLPPLRATGTMGSYDSENNILTLLLCRMPEGITDYVNSAWEIQDKPFSGDALNSYNDGPLEDGTQMGPFYELETSSPAAALKPGVTLSHIQFTVHLTGDIEKLEMISRKILGVGINEIKMAF